MALKIANHVVIIGKGVTKWKGNKETFLNDMQKHKEWIGI
jgi:ABC-type branched-subunit amino acid transport system ATPase component